MNVCKACGTRTDDEDIFCPSCGARLDTTLKSPQEKLIQKKVGKLAVLILVFAIIVLILKIRNIPINLIFFLLIILIIIIFLVRRKMR